MKSYNFQKIAIYNLTKVWLQLDTIQDFTDGVLEVNLFVVMLSNIKFYFKLCLFYIFDFLSQVQGSWFLV